ncbi:MAG: mitochondrial fission ELM1 family protein [Verrucomicrobiota bacterium]
MFTQPSVAEPLVVWRFLDGRPGHESQSEGMVDALSRLGRLEVHNLRVGSKAKALIEYACASFKAGWHLPAPSLLIGAGHATHLPMLAARRRFGGRVIVLMKPSMPLSCFDLCIVPEHDRPKDRANVIKTKGVLNTIRASEPQESGKGLILLGGESKHYRWDSDYIFEQLLVLLNEHRQMDWTLTSSRRTPDRMIDLLKSKRFENLSFVPHTATPKGWVAERMFESSEIWVTPDSVSMLYEAMTSINRVGVFGLASKENDSRVAAEVECLRDEGRLAGIDVQSKTIIRPVDAHTPLAETDRVARMIMEFFTL